ncbi:acetyl-CoA synthetase-like protein, partial [Ramicandelaber brevisporus]
LAPHYSWLTYADVLARSTSLGSGLAKLGVRLGESVGFFSKNSVEYFVAREACSQYGFVSVPLYDTLGPDAVSHIVGEADVTVVLTVSDKLVELLDQVAGKRVRHVVLMDNNERGAVAVPVLRQANAVGVQVLDMAAVEALGGAGTLIPPDRTPQPADILMICYTSGSTSVPKGVIITHCNMLATLASLIYLQKQRGTYATSPADTALSYLPLAHLMEQGLSWLLLCTGGRIGLYSGDVARVLEDLAILQPTVFTAVPRILNRLHDRVWATVRAKGGLALRMFEHAYDTKKAALHTTGATTHWLWDRLVFKTIRSLLGGNIRFLLSGSAPLSLEVLDFLRIASGAEVVSEGYGMTETTCSASVSSTDDVEAGHVGPPIPGLQIKLVDIPEMSYFSSDAPHPRGEICIKGASIFAGYHKQPEKTAEALDRDGWLHTGDVGLWDERGRLRIIDRVKNLVKL